MSLNIKLYLIAFLSFVVADTIWIGFVMKSFYAEQMISFGRIVDGKFEPVLWAALIVYLFLSIGVVDFVLPFTGLASAVTKYVSGFWT